MVLPRTAPLWFRTEPSAETIRTFLAGQEALPWSYAEVGATKAGAPAGFLEDHHRVRLGGGENGFVAAVAAVRRWTMFPRAWTRIFPGEAAVREDQVVGMLAHALGGWWLNACRIVYVIDEAGPVRRFGFAYGTLPGHVEQGEERFCVEWLADDSVWYDLRAFSRPRYWPARLGYPLTRRLQRRFARDSLAQMCAAVAAAVAADRRSGGESPS